MAVVIRNTSDSTASLGTDGTTVTDSATTVLGAIGVNSADNLFDSTSVMGNGNGSVFERLELIQTLSEPSANNKRYLTVPIPFSVLAWNTVAAHEVFVVTGLVRIKMWIECTASVDSAAHGGTIAFGNDGAGQAAQYIAATDETALVIGTLWYSATPALLSVASASAIMDYVVNGSDIGYTIAGEALTTGSLAIHCIWEPLNATGAVSIGGGGTFA
jgi:hypothetical protein